MYQPFLRNIPVYYLANCGPWSGVVSYSHTHSYFLSLLSYYDRVVAETVCGLLLYIAPGFHYLALYRKSLLTSANQSVSSFQPSNDEENFGIRTECKHFKI